MKEDTRIREKVEGIKHYKQVAKNNRGEAIRNAVMGAIWASLAIFKAFDFQNANGEGFMKSKEWYIVAMIVFGLDAILHFICIGDNRKQIKYSNREINRLQDDIIELETAKL